MPAVRLGALCWSQYTTWPELLEAGQRADRLGYDTLWTWDHLYPVVGDPHGPILEGWLTLAAWAQATERIRIGLMVGANTFRTPALTAKMVTTLDHISNGRAILGLGAAWFEPEHEAFGIPFGDGFPERLRWLGEALPIIRGMLRGERPSASGPRYAEHEVRNDPPPIQAALPILVGGGGVNVTLKLVARYGDLNNIGGGRREREAQGRDPRPALRDRRTRPRARSSARPGSARSSSATRGGRRSRSSRPSSSGRAGPSSGRTSRSARPRTSPSARSPTSTSGTGTSPPGSRARTTRSRWSGSRPRSGRSSSGRASCSERASCRPRCSGASRPARP